MMYQMCTKKSPSPASGAYHSAALPLLLVLKVAIGTLLVIVSIGLHHNRFSIQADATAKSVLMDRSEASGKATHRKEGIH